MARWEIKNVNIAGVAMAVPEHTVKTAEIDLFTQEEADIFDKTVGIKSRHIAPDTMCASDISWTEKFNLDVWYVDHCTLWTDIKVIWITIMKVVRRADINSESGESATIEAFNGHN